MFVIEKETENYSKWHRGRSKIRHFTWKKKNKIESFK